MRLASIAIVAALLGACANPFAAATAPVVPAPTVSPPVASAPIIVLRGAKVVGTPLFIIDGVPVPGSAINPADIEEVEVIKGPAAAALYAPPMRCPPIIIKTRKRNPAPPGHR
jgi:hypothetical protein